MKRILQGIVFLSIASLASADTFVPIYSRALQNPTDFIDWTQLGPDGAYFAPPVNNILPTPQLVTTFAGNQALVGNLGGAPFVRVDEGVSWVSNFDWGESLVWTGTGDATLGAGPGPFGIQLANPVGTVGFSIQTDLYGPFSATVQAYDSSFNLLGGLTYNNGYAGGLENGSALFIGLGDTTGVNISFITISTFASSDGVTSINDFAIDDPSFTYATAAPEPASLAVPLGMLLTLLGAIRRFKK
jgi:hypothetical protein